MAVLEVADLGRERAVAGLETVVLLLLRGDRLLEPPHSRMPLPETQSRYCNASSATSRVPATIRIIMGAED